MKTPIASSPYDTSEYLKPCRPILLAVLGMLILVLNTRITATAEDAPKISPEKLERVRSDAERGLAEAQSYLGACYATGSGVVKDTSEAVKWYRKAADQDLSAAQWFLGGCYAKGAGVQKDDAEAVNWYRKAAAHGLSEAQWSLGACYGAGTGVSQDWIEAVNWSRKAAEQGHADAQFFLGACYAEGTGVLKDYVTAYMWTDIAAAAGVTNAKDMRLRLSKIMTNEQILTAQRISREWKPKTQSSFFQPVEFKSTAGQFTVWTPATLKESVTTKTVVSSSEGQTYNITTHLFSGSQGDVVYSVSYADFPEWIFKLGDPKKITEGLLNATGSGTATLTNGKLLLETKINLGRYPGHEVLSQCQEQGQMALIKARYYIVERRYYEVSALIPSGKGEMNNINTYLDSFHLLK